MFKINKLILVNIIFGFILLGVFLFIYSQNSKQLISFEVITANDTMNDLLTRYSRNYVLTGNPAFKDKYFEVLNVRDGESPWDLFYQHPWFVARKESLANLLSEFNIPEESVESLQSSLKQSTELTWNEVSAMNYYDGFIDPTNSAKVQYDALTVKKFIKFPIKYDNATHEQITSFYNHLPKDNKPTDDETTITHEFLQQLSVNMLYSYEYIRLNEKISELNQNSIKNILIILTNKNTTNKILFVSMLVILILYNLFLNFSVPSNNTSVNRQF